MKSQRIAKDASAQLDALAAAKPHWLILAPSAASIPIAKDLLIQIENAGIEVPSVQPSIRGGVCLGWFFKHSCYVTLFVVDETQHTVHTNIFPDGIRFQSLQQLRQLIDAAKNNI